MDKKVSIGGHEKYKKSSNTSERVAKNLDFLIFYVCKNILL